MNILFITNKNPYSKEATGGAETSIKLLAEEFAKRGHKSTYLTSKKSTITSPLKKVTNIHNVSVYTATLRHRGRKSPFIKKIGDKLTTYYLSKIINQENIEIVYCFYELNLLIPLLQLKKRKINFKIVMRMAGLHWYEQAKKSQEDLYCYKDIFGSVDSVNFIHPKLKEMVEAKLRHLGVQLNFKDYLIGDIGSSVKPGRTKSYKALHHKKYKLIMAARFSDYQKRQDLLVKSISLIQHNVPLQLEFIGEGPREEDVKKMVTDLGLTKRIIFSHFTSQKELWSKLEDADLLCHTCEYEGLGKIIIESMALGLPVLVSDVHPLSSYIIDGENGFLAQNDETVWAQKIESLLKNKEQRILVSNNSINYIKENYSPSKNILLYESAFRGIIEKKQLRP